MAAVVAVSVALIGLPVAWFKGQSVYLAEATVYVSPRFVKNLSDDQELKFQSNSQYRQYVQQQVRTINRFDILVNAIEQLEEQKVFWLRPEERMHRAAKRLQASLRIRPVPDTYLITVSLEGNRPKGLDEIVNSVVSAYLIQQKVEEVYASDERVKSLEKERERLLGLIGEKIDRRMQLSQDLGVTTFAESFLNPFDQLLISSQETLASAETRKAEAEAKLGALKDERGTGGRRSLEAVSRELVNKDSGFNSLKANLNQRRSELLTKRSGLASEHPGRHGIDRELTEIDAELNRVSRELIASFGSNLIGRLEAEVFETTHVATVLSRRVKVQSERAREFASGYHEAMALGAELERSRNRLAAVEDRIDFLLLETTAPGFVRLGSPALAQDLPYKGGKKKMFFLLLLLAVGLGVVAPVVADSLDPRIHTPSDLGRILGFPLLGWVLDSDETYMQRFSRDQLMRLVAGLDRARLEQKTKSFLLTSVKSGGGTTSLALELARELTDIGVRAIAVEANAFKPDGRYPNGKGDVGLCDLITGSLGLDDVIARAEGSMPDRISIGHGGSKPQINGASRSRDQTVLLVGEGDRFAEVVREALGETGYILMEEENWSAAVEIIREDCPGLILLSPEGQKFDGSSAIRTLRDYGCKAPILVASEDMSYREVDTFLELGADGCIPSNISAAELQAEVFRVSRRSGACVREMRRIHGIDKVLLDLYAHYDVVLVDGPPILLSADAEILVRITDATLLVVEAEGVNRGEVQRAVHTLERLSASSVGAILNRVQVYDGGGYFSNLLKEYQTGKKRVESKWRAPWLWS